ncbi:MAG: GTP 3',8-cyclase MoaA [Myxococcales bacterium]|nr:GTP 3',8-cyclase MoaA [Myxococcales bacterium]
MTTLVRLRVPSEVPPGPPVASRELLVDRNQRRVRYLRMSLTDRCSMRCTYCMPSEGIEHVRRSEVLSLEEVVAVARSFAAWGVERVRLTGGEPTLRRNLPWLVEALAAIEVGADFSERPGQRLQVVMTSNGELLAPMIGSLRDAGLAGLSISLDSLDPARFAAITRRDRLDAVVAGVDAAAAAGYGGGKLKINTVAVRGFNDDEVGRLCEFAWAREATPRFIELMPMAGGRLFVPGELMPAAQIRERVREHVGGELEAQGRPTAAVGPAHYWRVQGGPHDGRGFGVIAAMTENFCDSCNRLRVSATGQLHACLARDDSGDLRAALRSGGPEALATVVAAALGQKRDTHDFAIDGRGGPNKAMISIGG